MSENEMQANLEKRDDERIEATVKVKFHEIARDAADQALVSGDFTEVFASEGLSKETAENQPEGAPEGAAFTENISISGLRLVGDLQLIGGKALAEGAYLTVEIQLPDAPIPVRTLATVIWSEVLQGEPKFKAGLFFVGINRHDVAKVARFLILQKRAKHS